MKKFLSLVLTVIMLLCLMPTTLVFAASVTMVDAVNIELPVAGEKPDFSADLPNWSNAHKITGVEWVEYDEGWEWEKDMSANDTSSDADMTDSESQETDVNAEQEKENSDKDSGILIWIILGAVVVLAAGGAVTFIVIKKKKAE